MKKFLIICIIALTSIVSNAQSLMLFTRRIILDKFDDTILDERKKTLVTIEDDTLIIEEKGCNPVVLKLNNLIDFEGSKDNIVNLYDNVYGYQTVYYCCSEDNTPFIFVYRVIADKYSKSITDEIVWLERLDSSRIVYMREVE